MKKHKDLPYCGEDILPFLGSLKCKHYNGSQGDITVGK